MSSLLLALLPLVSLPHPSAQDGAPTAEVVLRHMQAALGAPEANLESSHRRLRGVASWEGLDGRGTFVETLGDARRARRVTTFPGFGEFSRASDGRLAWERTPGRVEVKQGWDACAELRQIAILGGADWRGSYVAARRTGAEPVDGRSCHRLELVPKALVEVPPGAAPRPDVWWIDQETHLPRRIDVYSGATREARLHLDDWREVGGARYAHRRRIEVNGFVQVLEYSSIEHGVALEASFFDPEEDVVAAASAAPEESAETADLPPEIELETLEEVHVAAVRVTCKASELQKTFAVILPEAHRYVISAGLESGEVFARYHHMGEEIDVEGGVIIDSPVAGQGRVKSSTLPAGLTAVTWHVGPYHTLGETHARLVVWMEENGLESNGAPWEEYWTDPGMEPDSSKWRTRVLQPVR